MKMFVQHPGLTTAVTQFPVVVKELHKHEEGVYIAIHQHYFEPGLWVASDLLTGRAITTALSKKYALKKANLVIKKNKEKLLDRQFEVLKKLINCSADSIDTKQLHRISKNRVKRGLSPSVIEIKSDYAGDLWISEG